MNRYIAFEKKEIKKVSFIVGLVLLLSYLLENIFSTVMVLVLTIFGHSSDSINELLLNPWSGYTLNSFLVIFVCIFPLCLLKFISKQPISSICCFNSPKRKNFITCIGFALGFSLIANVITAVFNIVLERVFDFKAVTSDLGSNTSDDPFEFVFILVCSAVVPALVEEFAFRGMVFGTLRRFGDVPAIFISALVFALFHGNFVQIPFAFIVGVVLAYVVVISGSIWTAVISHFLINAYAIVMNALMDDFANQISILFYVVIFIGLLCLTRLVRKDAFKSINNRQFALSTKSKFFTMLFSPSIVIFIVFMLYKALEYRV